MQIASKARKMLVADLLCGAGGSSTGAQRALKQLGLEMELVCLNHWPTAIETHQRNHPEARHYVQDIATVRPHLIVPEGYLDLLMASPTCTHHSVARGGKPTSDQQRSDPWHIITWLTELRVKRIIIENVWEFCGWGPVDPKTGKPIKERKGEYFHAWIETIKRLGFEPEWRKLNAADFGDATTRQRFILMARSDDRKVSWPMPTHRKRDDVNVDLFSAAQPWRPAREIIDWSIKGKSIFGRKKALAPKTLARIYAGAVKFGWPEPYLVILRRHMDGRSINEPIPSLATAGHVGIAEPVVVRTNMHGRKSPGARGSGDPLMTITTDGGIAVAEAIVVSPRHGKEGAGPRPRGVDMPLPTITAGGSQLAVAEPVIMNGRKGNQAKRVSIDPVPTLDTKGGVWLAEPMVLSQHNSGAPRSTEDPLPTITTGGAGAEKREGCARPMLVEPFVLSRHADGTARSVDEPTPTQVAKHSHLLITSYYGASQTAGSGDDPLPTVTTKDRFGIVVPVTHADGSNRARDIEIDPLPTLTTANRGELAFITVQHGERPGQAPRVHDLTDPAPTIAASGHVDLIEPGAGYDILFRMLEPHELAAAMGFNTEESTYEFAGTKTQKIKQIGNAVSVAKMKACVSAIMADEAPTRSEPATAEFQEAAE